MQTDRLVLVVLGVAFRELNWTVRGGLHRSVPRASLRVWGKCVWWQSGS